MINKSNYSLKQAQADTPLDEEQNKLQKTVNKLRNIKLLVTERSSRQSNIITESDALQEFNPKSKLKRCITFEQVDREELDRYKTEWHWNIFFEFLFYHLVFYIILGPFFILFFWKWPGVPLTKNLRFWKHHPQFYMQFLLWGGSIFGGLFYFMASNSVVTLTEIIFMWGAITIRSVVISAKYATLSEARIRLYKNEVLPDQMFSFDLMFADWYYQSGKVKFLEQYRAMRRHEFEPQIYRFDFLIQPLDKTKQQIMQTDICFYLEWSMKQHSNQTDPLFDEHIYNGFHIFSFLVGEYQRLYPPYSFQKYVVTLSILLSITPVLIRMNNFIEHSPSSFDLARLVVNIITSMQAFYGSFIFLAISIYDFKRKFFLLDQCLYMLQAKNVKYSSAKKLIPTLNFNNPSTLQAWSMLRSIAFDYGQTYNLRTQGFQSIVFFANIVLIIIGLALLLDLINLRIFELCLLGEMAAVLFGFMVAYLYYGSALNNYFDIFETLLDDLKSIYLDIKRMREQYFDNNIAPINDVHKIFVNILKDQVKTEAVKDYIEQLIAEIDDNLRHLNYDRRNNPFKLYGVVVTFNLLKSAGVGLSTVFSYALQQRLQTNY